MWLLIVIGTVAVMFILGMIFSKRFVGASSGAIFFAESSEALKQGKPIQEALFAGLRVIQKQKFFNQLTDEELLMLAISFTELEDPKYLQATLVSAVKNNDIDMLRNPATINDIVNKYKMN